MILQSRKNYLVDLLVGVLFVMAAEAMLYIYLNEEYSYYVYFKSVVEIFAAPFYPGVFLIYPAVIATIFSIGLYFGGKLTSRAGRMALNSVVLLLWSALGLFTIMQWYR